MQSRGGGMSGGGKVNYGSTERRDRTSSRSNPFDDDNEDDNVTSPFLGRNGGGGSLMDMRDAISGDIITIGSSVSALERSLKVIGTNKDTSQLREKIHESEQTTNKVIAHAATSLKRLSTLCPRNDRVERLHCERLTGEFKEVTRRYNDLQRKVADKVKLCAPPSTVHPAQPATANLLGWNDGDDPQPHQQQQQRQEQVGLFEEVSDTDMVLLQEREQQIRQLEGDIIDVNEIFKQLGALVREQGEVVDSIEAHVESAHTDVELGNEQLRQAANYQMKARKKKCCLLVICLVVVAVIILIIVLAVEVHK